MKHAAIITWLHLKISIKDNFHDFVSTGKLVFVTVFVVVIVHIRTTVVSLVTVTFEKIVQN